LSRVPGTAALPIAIVLTSFVPGGTERQMIELVRRLDPGRWTVHIACSRACGEWLPRAAEAAASIEEFPLRSFRHPDTLRQMRRFSRWCADRRIAVVHTTELYSNIFALPAAAFARVAVRIGNRREINPDKTPAQIGLQRLSYRFAHRVVANSQAAAARLRAERVSAGKIAVVPNGLDLGPYPLQPASRPLRRVIMVANLRPEKGHDTLIEAAAALLPRFPEATFEFVGAGPLQERLVARARTAGVSHACWFAGHCNDVARRLAAADIFVLPSRSEAFPNAVLEAMAAGLPIVASAVGGIPELISHERTGLLVPPGNAPVLAATLARLMSEDDLGRRLGAAARAEVQGRYSFDRMVAAFEQIYTHELSRHGLLPARRPQLAAS
jgi:glycosyltransferase involved in cell wall biosynthesis